MEEVVFNRLNLYNNLLQFYLISEDVLMFENFDLDNIITPIKASTLKNILDECGYDKSKTNQLYHGFQEGFMLGYEGDPHVKLTASNLKFRIGSELELWNKVMKEVQAKRYAGPFKEIPFKDGFIQSPIGLVPKDGGKQTRLIFHLLHPRNCDKNLSVNANTNKQLCTVHYPDFSKAIQLCLKEGISCNCRKSDGKSAFCQFPIKREHWKFLVIKARCPLDKCWYYFVDKCMPFGNAISCAHFQMFSDAIAFIMLKKTGKEVVNYLDDFLFIALLHWLCDRNLQAFLDLCDKIGFPISMEKMQWSNTVIVFLGMLIDTVWQTVSIPRDKVLNATTLIEQMLSARKRKVTVAQVQKLCGTLNFLSRAIIPGHPFMMRMYASLSGMKQKELKPHHHVILAQDMILDLRTWLLFLESPQAYSRPFIDFTSYQDAVVMDWYTDAAKSRIRGFGGHHDRDWFW